MSPAYAHIPPGGEKIRPVPLSLTPEDLLAFRPDWGPPNLEVLVEEVANGPVPLSVRLQHLGQAQGVERR